ncbi:hypothetical protein FI667_g787, partial [Globisporangium splendens]
MAPARPKSANAGARHASTSQHRMDRIQVAVNNATHDSVPSKDPPNQLFEPQTETTDAATRRGGPSSKQDDVRTSSLTTERVPSAAAHGARIPASLLRPGSRLAKRPLSAAPISAFRHHDEPKQETPILPPRKFATGTKRPHSAASRDQNQSEGSRTLPWMDTRNSSLVRKREAVESGVTARDPGGLKVPNRVDTIAFVGIRRRSPVRAPSRESDGHLSPTRGDLFGRSVGMKQQYEAKCDYYTISGAGFTFHVKDDNFNATFVPTVEWEREKLHFDKISRLSSFQLMESPHGRFPGHEFAISMRKSSNFHLFDGYVEREMALATADAQFMRHEHFQQGSPSRLSPSKPSQLRITRKRYLKKLLERQQQRPQDRLDEIRWTMAAIRRRKCLHLTKFVKLVDFMQIDAYFAVILRSVAVVYNHLLRGANAAQIRKLTARDGYTLAFHKTLDASRNNPGVPADEGTRTMSKISSRISPDSHRKLALTKQETKRFLRAAWRFGCARFITDADEQLLQLKTALGETIALKQSATDEIESRASRLESGESVLEFLSEDKQQQEKTVEKTHKTRHHGLAWRNALFDAALLAYAGRFHFEDRQTLFAEWERAYWRNTQTDTDRCKTKCSFLPSIRMSLREKDEEQDERDHDLRDNEFDHDEDIADLFYRHGSERGHWELVSGGGVCFSRRRLQDAFFLSQVNCAAFPAVLITNCTNEIEDLVLKCARNLWKWSEFSMVSCKADDFDQVFVAAVTEDHQLLILDVGPLDGMTHFGNLASVFNWKATLKNGVEHLAVESPSIASTSLSLASATSTAGEAKTELIPVHSSLRFVLASHKPQSTFGEATLRLPTLDAMLHASEIPDVIFDKMWNPGVYENAESTKLETAVREYHVVAHSESSMQDELTKRIRGATVHGDFQVAEMQILREQANANKELRLAMQRKRMSVEKEIVHTRILRHIAKLGAAIYNSFNTAVSEHSPMLLSSTPGVAAVPTLPMVKTAIGYLRHKVQLSSSGGAAHTATSFNGTDEILQQMLHLLMPLVSCQETWGRFTLQLICTLEENHCQSQRGVRQMVNAGKVPTSGPPTAGNETAIVAPENESTKKIAEPTGNESRDELRAGGTRGNAENAEHSAAFPPLASWWTELGALEPKSVLSLILHGATAGEHKSKVSDFFATSRSRSERIKIGLTLFPQLSHQLCDQMLELYGVRVQFSSENDVSVQLLVEEKPAALTAPSSPTARGYDIEYRRTNSSRFHRIDNKYGWLCSVSVYPEMSGVLIISHRPFHSLPFLQRAFFQTVFIKVIITPQQHVILTEDAIGINSAIAVTKPTASPGEALSSQLVPSMIRKIPTARQLSTTQSHVHRHSDISLVTSVYPRLLAVVDNWAMLPVHLQPNLLCIHDTAINRNALGANSAVVSFKKCLQSTILRFGCHPCRELLETSLLADETSKFKLAMAAAGFDLTALADAKLKVPCIWQLLSSLVLFHSLLVFRGNQSQMSAAAITAPRMNDHCSTFATKVELWSKLGAERSCFGCCYVMTPEWSCDDLFTHYLQWSHFLRAAQTGKRSDPMWFWAPALSSAMSLAHIIGSAKTTCCEQHALGEDDDSCAVSFSLQLGCRVTSSEKEPKDDLNEEKKVNEKAEQQDERFPEGTFAVIDRILLHGTFWNQEFEYLEPLRHDTRNYDQQHSVSLTRQRVRLLCIVEKQPHSRVRQRGSSSELLDAGSSTKEQQRPMLTALHASRQRTAMRYCPLLAAAQDTDGYEFLLLYEIELPIGPSLRPFATPYLTLVPPATL